MKESISNAELCQLTGLTDRRHRQLADQGWFPLPSKGEYPLVATLQGLFKYYREQQHVGRNLKDQKTAKEIEVLTLEKEDRQIDINQKTGKLLELDTVWQTWERIVIAFKQRMMILPNKIQSQLGLTVEQSKLVQIEIDAALLELSEPLQYEQPTNQPTGEN